MRIEEFSVGDSVVHRMDPRTKIVVAAVYSVVVAVTQSLLAAGCAMVLPLVLIPIARLSVRGVLARLAVVNGFILFLWLVLPFTVPGEALVSFGPLTVYREGILQALLISVKSNAIVLTVIALLGTTPVLELVHAAGHLGVPNKLVHLFFFCFRYLHVIHEEYHRLMEAAKIRGFRPDTSMHTYRTYAYLLGMLLVRSFERSRRIVDAMKCRGFKGRFYILHHYNMAGRDLVLAASGVSFSFMLVFL
jgi:cobalt/nickel transport system permease protein